MKMRTLSSTLVALGLGVAASLAVAAPAQAATHTMHTDDGDPGGRVTFTTNGDIVRLCDIEADGWAVGLVVDDYGVGRQYSMQVGGNGTCKEVRASMGGKYDLSEGSRIGFYIYLHKSSNLDAYSDESTWRNIN
ncbi:hypothetical protein [Plantactinospora mayteni]|uniref:Secreted protein n=1 Tax=Plantactinospora mayteni TaxID=566021 RepID=A0ABQ4F3Z8_9ACTN|nr:hypothetical protein [Plantactinospora mayteni]GIH01627.1 hypothetical protein Pma05_81990 [Plantactinospora mayteni]